MNPRQGRGELCLQAYPTTESSQSSKTGGQFLRWKKKKKKKETLAIRLVSGQDRPPSFARGFSRHLRFDMSYPGRYNDSSDRGKVDSRLRM